MIYDQLRNIYPGCWTEQTLEICHKHNLGVQLIKCMKTNNLKKLLKERIRKRLERRNERERRDKTKLRFSGGFGKKKYILKGKLSKNMIKGIMKIRLNMLELNCNYKGTNRNETCGLCKRGKDTTEHLFECSEIRKIVDKVPDIAVMKSDSEEAYLELGDFVKQICELRGIDLNKTVQENFDNFDKKLEERKIYQIKSFDETTLRMVISIS